MVLMVSGCGMCLLERSDSPPVSSFTRRSKNGVTSLPAMAFFLEKNV